MTPAATRATTQYRTTLWFLLRAFATCAALVLLLLVQGHRQPALQASADLPVLVLAFAAVRRRLRDHARGVLR